MSSTLLKMERMFLQKLLIGLELKKIKTKKMWDDLNKKMQLNAETVNVLFYTK